MRAEQIPPPPDALALALASHRQDHPTKLVQWRRLACQAQSRWERVWHLCPGLDHVFAALDQADAGLDMVYLDGHHDEVATVHYVQRLLPRLRPGALVILDDIYLYQDMWRAWNRIRTMPGISVAVNLGRFGLLIWNEGHSRPAPFDLSRYTGWWRMGGSRRETILGACTPT